MMEYTKKELPEARRQIVSTLHKLRSTIVTLQSKENPARYKSQITLLQCGNPLIRGHLPQFFLAQPCQTQLIT